MKKSSYKTFDATSADPVSHRHDVVQGLYPPGMVPLDPNFYPARNRDVVKDIIVKVREIDYKLMNPDTVPCNCMGGYNSITTCVCQANKQPFNGNPLHQIALLGHARVKLAEQLENLRDDGEESSHTPGDVIKIPMCPNLLYALLQVLGVNFKVDWVMREKFHTADTRPSHERHISLTTTAFWVVEQNRLRVVVQVLGKKFRITLPRTALRFLSVPVRDLVVSLDHIRATRRGRLGPEADASLKAILQTSMAVPLNDPNFILQRIDPMRDAYLFARAAMKGYVPSYVDF